MDISRRGLAVLSLGLAASFPLTSRLRAAEVEVADNGLHVQDWFLQSFLDLSEDLTTAAEQGKSFAIIWEQKGCPYCRELHQVNLTKPKIVDYLKANFDILQLDMWGSRAVTDFDGAELEERDLAKKSQVVFTPTIQFFPRDLKAIQGNSNRELEVMRMPGYFKPFHFISMFEYVHEGAYADQQFQRYLQDKFGRLEAEGKKPDIW